MHASTCGCLINTKYLYAFIQGIIYIEITDFAFVAVFSFLQSLSLSRLWSALEASLFLILCSVVCIISCAWHLDLIDTLLFLIEHDIFSSIAMSFKMQLCSIGIWRFLWHGRLFSFFSANRNPYCPIPHLSVHHISRFSLRIPNYASPIRCQDVLSQAEHFHGSSKGRSRRRQTERTCGKHEK